MLLLVACISLVMAAPRRVRRQLFNPLFGGGYNRQYGGGFNQWQNPGYGGYRPQYGGGGYSSSSSSDDDY